METPKSITAWLGIAIASGACAAFNGVFAKLTTTELTSNWAHAIAHAFGFEGSGFVEVVVRGLFFALNLLFNAIMWLLFTRALTLASSTVRVSIINTSANFIITALLGLVVFSEKLPGLWWLGAASLVVGSVVIGMREGVEEGKNTGAGNGGGSGSGSGGGLGEGDRLVGENGEFRDEGEEDVVELGSVGEDSDSGRERGHRD